MVTIKDNRHKKPLRYIELSIGDCFMYRDTLYMVTADSILKENVYEDYDEEDVVNAIQLGVGFLTRIDPNAIVTPVDVEIALA